mgnify:CR=1 FL=1
MKTEHLENRDEQKWESVNQLLSKVGSHLNILEEEIDVDVQYQYMKLFEYLAKKKNIKFLSEDAISHAQDLFDDSISDEKKKILLTTLATVNDVSIYRVIEAFQKQASSLKSWATIALQQSRMIIQSSLLDESTVFLSSGLGGRGSLLRYFCVYFANKGVELQPFQWDIAKKESELVINHHKGVVEQFNCYPQYVTFTILLPIEVNLKEIFNAIIDECNTYGNFLQEDIILTNVKKLAPEEIDAFLKSKDNH